MADYREAMGTADDLTVVVAAVNQKWDEHIETLKAAASALGLTNEVLQQYIDLADKARETEIAKAEAERIKTLTDPFRDLAEDLAAMQYNLAGFQRFVRILPADFVLFASERISGPMERVGHIRHYPGKHEHGAA